MRPTNNNISDQRKVVTEVGTELSCDGTIKDNTCNMVRKKLAGHLKRGTGQTYGKPVGRQLSVMITETILREWSGIQKERAYRSLW